MNTSFKNKKGNKRSWALPNLNLQYFIFPLLAIVIALILYPYLLSSVPDYKIGDIAKRNIKASNEYLVEDKSLTEHNIYEAIKSVLPVYDFDNSGGGVINKIREAFNFARIAASSSFFAEQLQSKNNYNTTMQKDEKARDRRNAPIAEEADKTSFVNKNEFVSNFFELLDIPAKINIFDTLTANKFTSEIQEYLEQIIMEVLSNGVVGNFRLLLNDLVKGILLHNIQSGDKSVVKDAQKFLELPAAEAYLRSKIPILEKNTSPELATAIVDLAIALIKPNLNFNSRETELLKDQAKKNIKPFYFKVQQGEMLVRDGDLITEASLIKLTAQKDYLKSKNVFVRIPAIALLVGLVLMVIGKTDIFKSSQNTKNKDITLCAIIILSNLIIMVVMTIIADELTRAFSFISYETLYYIIPITIASMLISIFIGFNAAFASAVIMSILSGFLFNISGQSITMFLFFFTCSILAAHEVKRIKAQDAPIKAGIKVGCLGILLVIGIKIFKGELLTWDTPWAMAAAFAGGIMAGVITMGTIPIIEMTFGYTTDTKLLELANLDQPLLRELMLQAPGTYHHSVIVSNMVETTAEVINANPLLAKVAAYYHDIGKIKKPLYFIENQMGQGNKHERLEPSMSNLILISHVKDGVELAKTKKLGKEIIDIIQQHHGTSLIAYFFSKAKEQAGKKGRKTIIQDMEADFRYPGPNPQTKEAGLIMLADAVEAATRSLSDYSPARIQGMIQKIFNKIFSDGQLNECELTLKDLNEIAKSFNKILRGIFHPRIEYPNQAAKISSAKRGPNESFDNQQDGVARNKSDEKDSGETLKRLGL